MYLLNGMVRRRYWTVAGLWEVGKGDHFVEIHTIGIDLGKTVFHLVGVDARGEVVVRKKFSRLQLLRFYSEQASLSDRHGSMRRIALPRPRT